MILQIIYYIQILIFKTYKNSTINYLKHSTNFIPFKPHPLVPGGHLQTIFGYYLPSPKLLQPTKIHQVQLSDGDRLTMCENQFSQKPQVNKAILFMHGLGGHAESPYMIHLASLFLGQGWTTFRLNHRGCGDGVGMSKKLYHSGRSADVSRAIIHINKLYPDIPLIAVGFSLSGNMLLKLIGESIDPIPDNLCGAITIAPPIDLSFCAQALSKNQNRIYDFRFVRLLKDAVKERQTCFPDFPNFQFPRKMTVRQFDEICVAPLNNFDSAEDYYAKCSAKQFLSDVSVPAFIIVSADDPFVPKESFTDLPENEFLNIQITKSGGHLGFVSAYKTPIGNHRWMDYAILMYSKNLIEANTELYKK